MNESEKRRILCEKCVIVSTYNKNFTTEQLKAVFPELDDAQPLISAGLLATEHMSWILKFTKNDDAEKYLRHKSVKTSEGEINISQCECPCDIPEAWVLGPETPRTLTTGDDQNYQRLRVNEDLLQSLRSMGFSDDESEKGLLHTGNNDLNAAVEWIFNNKDNAPKLQNVEANPICGPVRYPYAIPYNQMMGPFCPPGFQPPSHPGYHPPYSLPWQFQHLPTQQGRQPDQHLGQEEHGKVQRQTSGGRDESVVGTTLTSHIRRSSDTNHTKSVYSPIKMSKDGSLEKAASKPKMIKVTNLPPETTEENLTLFFENTRRSGGGEVENVDFDLNNGTAIVTFAEEDAVDIVLKKRPMTFMKSEINVDVHLPENQKIKETERKTNTESETNIPSYVIEVHGVKPTTQELTLRYYFEGKKGADEDIIEMEYIEDKNLYLLTFGSEDAVTKVIGKTHKIDGASLEVKKYVPPERYTNKVVLQGITNGVTEDNLTNYIEGRTKIDVDRVDYSEINKETAVVTFCQAIDIKEIQEACNTKPLEKVYLKVKPVFVSNCILVTGFAETTTESSLEYYFDNKRKSGVDRVKEVVMKDGYCLVFFEDTKDAEKACQRQHIVDHCNLTVQIYYDCLGPPNSSYDKEAEATELTPVFINDINPIKFNFLKTSKTLQQIFSQRMVEVNSRIIWPVSDSEPLKLECVLPCDDPNFHLILESWEETVKQHFEKLLEGISIKKHLISKETRDTVLREIHMYHADDTDLVHVIYESGMGEIMVVGQDSSVQQLSAKIELTINEVSDSLQRQSQEVIDEIRLEDYQFSVLSQAGVLKDVINRYHDLELTVHQESSKIRFKGLSNDINMAKMEIYEQLTSIKPSIVPAVSTAYVKFISRPEVKSFIENEIRARGQVGAWVVANNNVTVYSCTGEDATAVAKIIKENIVELKIQIEDSNKQLLHSGSWNKLIGAIDEECKRQAIAIEIDTFDDSEVCIICNSKLHAKTFREKIQDFIFENSSREQTIRFSKEQMQYIRSKHQDKIDDITYNLQKIHISISFKTDCIIVHGNRKQIKKAMQEIDPIVKIMQGIQQKEDIKPVAPYGLGLGSVVASFTAESGQSIMVLCCDISGLNVDVIVSPADPQLSNSGGLSKIISDEGGPDIQRQCRDYRQKHRLLQEGELFCSSPGNLSCKMVFHAVGPAYQSLQSNEEEILTQCIHSILEQMDKRQFQTIAIPALATGTSQYPVDEATATIADTIRGYFKKHPFSNVKIIYLCDISAKRADCFVSAAGKVFKGSSKKPLIPETARGTTIAGQPVPQVRIAIQDLAQTQVDVIVNTTSQDLQLSKSGAVSSSLIKVGGITLQQECQQKYPNGTQFGNVAVTSGGNLPCRLVFHGALPQWNRDGSSLKILKQFVTNCLNMVVNSYRYKSIAFPSLGTGRLDYPPGQVAREMFNAVATHYQSYPQSTLQDVLFVLYHRDYATVTAFEDEEKRRSPKQHSRRKDRL